MTGTGSHDLTHYGLQARNSVCHWFFVLFAGAALAVPDNAGDTNECCAADHPDLVHTSRFRLSSLTCRARYLGVEKAWNPYRRG